MKIQKWCVLVLVFLCGCSSSSSTTSDADDGGDDVPETSDLASFPGAEGFGAGTTGGRGGTVITVTNLNVDGEGSLQAALDTEGAKIIVFEVSGLIDGVVRIRTPDTTIAGQTSPGGITVRGLVCDNNVYDSDSECHNIIVRHIRSRPQDATVYPGDGDVNDDALRLDGAQNVIIDHCSFANATDEAIQISLSSNITIQNSILAETIGGHFELGGMLINYSSESLPLTDLSIHHNMWNRIGGRMPEISCEDNDTFEGTNCEGHTIDLELSNNLLWDPGIYIYYEGITDPTERDGSFALNLNWVGNFMGADEDFTYGMIAQDILEREDNSYFFSDNGMNLYPEFEDEELATCCNDYNVSGAYAGTITATVSEARHDFPAITYTASNSLADYMVENVGAFPRDPMDRRLLSFVEAGTFDAADLDVAGEEDAFDFDFDEGDPPTAPVDTDGDGMSDAWEAEQGLDPAVDDSDGTGLSVALTGAAGYTNIECYINAMSDELVAN